MKSIPHLLLSVEGRIPRSVWWAFTLISFALMAGLTTLDVVMGTYSLETGYGVFSGIAALVLLWPSIAVGVKRCHDRNRTGWFLLVALIPLVNLWLLVELAFLAGSVGANRYGDDPRTPSAAPSPA